MSTPPLLQRHDPHARTPVPLRCDFCQHAWTGGYLPMEISAFARLMTATTCPRCGAGSAQLRLCSPQDLPPATTEPAPMTHRLSDRVRTGSEADPWVVDEIRRLEAQLATAIDASNRRPARPAHPVDLARMLKHGTPDCTHHWTTTSACPLCLRGRIVRMAEQIVTLRSRGNHLDRQLDDAYAELHKIWGGHRVRFDPAVYDAVVAWWDENNPPDGTVLAGK